MQPIVPAVGVIAYILAKPLLVVLCKQLGTTGKSYPFFLFVVLHNFLLLSFSAMVFYESWAVSTFSSVHTRRSFVGVLL
jgi:hypothetical protein